VEVVSLDGLLCDASRCVSSLDGQLLYVDGAHLTHEGSVRVAQRLGFGAWLNPLPAAAPR
jgi:hypothetical protein